MSNYVTDSAPGKSLSAYVIMKGARNVATVTAAWGRGASCLVNVRQDDKAAARSVAAATKYHGGKAPDSDLYFQHARASGYGYDKFTSALSCLWIDGYRMGDHCGTQGAPKRPKGLKYYPEGFKVPRGFTMANYGRYMVATGERVDSYQWRDKAMAELGADADMVDIRRRAMELERAADTVGGYSSCYRREGLNFLSEVGYTVIQAI